MAATRVDKAEHTNYNKFNQLLVDVTGKVLRKLLETKALIQKPSLHDYLTALTIQQCLNNITPGVIKQRQAELIYPPGGEPADINTWDITLLCAVLNCVGNLTKRERKNIDEIKRIRNATVGHLPQARLTNTEFTGYWADMTKVINSILPRIGDQAFGNDIYSLIASIKRDKNLDPLLAIVQTWKKDEEDFIATRALTSVVQLLETDNSVTIVGVSGSGKSGIAHHIALELGKQGYAIYPVERAEEIIVHGNMAEKQVFVLDDPVGKHEIDLNELKEFERFHQKLEALIHGGVKVLVTCRKNIVNDNRFKAYTTLLGKTVVDLGAKENLLSNNEKLSMFIRYVGNANVTDARKYEITQREYTNFPLLCKVFASNYKYGSNIVTFFKAPFPILVGELDMLKQRDKHQYCALILCLVFDKYFDTSCLNEFNRDDNTVRKVEDIMAVCGLPRDEPLVNVRNAFEALNDVYFIKEQTRYRYIHDVLFDAVAFQFGRDYPKEMLKHCSSRFMREHVRTEGIQSDDRFAIRMPEEGYIHMAERLCKDLMNGQFHDVFLNPSFSDDDFADTFCKYLMGLNDTRLNLVLFGKGPDLEGFIGLIEETDFRRDKTWFIQHLLLFDDIRVIHWILAYNHFKLFQTCHSVLGNLAQFPHIHDAGGRHSFQERAYHEAVILFACLSGNICMFNTVLLDCNFMDISAIRFGNNDSTLHIAIISGNIAMVDKIINMGVNVNVRIGINSTPLLLSSYLGNVEMCDHLLQTHRAGVNLCTEEKHSPLYIAVQEGHTECVSVLLKHGADISLCKDDGYSPLHIAAQEGHTECVSVLLKHGADVSLCADNAFSPLYIAAQNGHTECVSVLLKHGADVSLCADKGFSPLHIAAQNGHAKCVSLLLKHGAVVTVCTDKGFSPLHIAAQEGHTECVSVLLKHGADLSLCADNGFSPLHIAAQEGHTECVSVLLKHGADVSLCADNAFSPLYIAAQNGHTECVSVLLKHGGDVTVCTDKGFSPLHIAAQEGHTECVSVLLKHGADVTVCTDKGFSPLHIAAQEGHAECVSVLLKHGADVSLCTDKGFSPLHIAAQNGRTECVSIILKHGAVVTVCTDKGFSPLHIAAQNGRTECVSVLLKRGAGVSLCADNGFSPLHIAAQNGRTECVSVLLKHGAGVGLCAGNGASPLHIAAQNGHTECVSVLLKHGADVSLCADKGFSPLYIAAHSGHTECVSVLLKHGADVSLCTDDGYSPLYIAAQEGHTECVSVLLKHGADVSLCTDDGFSPLHIAAQEGRTECVSVLLKYGADVNLCTGTGKTPLHIAAYNGHRDVLSILLPHYSNINIGDNTFRTPLHWACINSQRECVRVLLQAGAKVTTRATDTGRSPLDDANHTGDAELATLLINAGANAQQ